MPSFSGFRIFSVVTPFLLRRRNTSWNKPQHTSFRLPLLSNNPVHCINAKQPWKHLPGNTTTDFTVPTNILAKHLNRCLAKITHSNVLFSPLSPSLSVVYMYTHERNLILMFLHVCRNRETVLINCLFVLIISVCGIVVFICVCSIARTGC